VLVANVRELHEICRSDRKSEKVDAEKLARYARLDPRILRPIAHQSVAMIRAREIVHADGSGQRCSRAHEVMGISAARVFDRRLSKTLSGSLAEGLQAALKPMRPD
jgi:transposase